MGIKSKDELRELYGWPSGRAKAKVLNGLEKHSKHFITSSPFFVMSTFDQNGKSDASPRGGRPGFVKIVNDSTILVPDAKGNNRVDSLINIVETGSIGCLFMIPGIDETLRLNGKAIISTDITDIGYFDEERLQPIACLKITIDEVFLHCAKALMRSELWSKTNQMSRPDFPTMGKMLNEQLKMNGKVESQDEMLKRYRKTL